ncbi:hypothetical protein LWI28_028788 [Acer negundo]|uniref:Uncharacterized protein n=1 Tax=Acer negundo TaxID=4023 RepID=A0AAD5J2X9_ACENE|nr:hypothetical protein LWI28_028788 [Acer negundo]
MFLIVIKPRSHHRLKIEPINLPRNLHQHHRGFVGLMGFNLVMGRAARVSLFRNCQQEMDSSSFWDFIEVRERPRKEKRQIEKEGDGVWCVRKIADLGKYPVGEVIGEDGKRVYAIGVGITFNAVPETASSLQSPL